MTSTLAPLPMPQARPVPWQRLSWVAWRRYRAAFVTITALLAAATVVLVIRGEHMRHAYAALQACTPVRSARCGFVFTTFQDTYANLGPIGGLFVFVPGLIGTFTGAPLLARELETGTFRFAWTQGAGRMRWLIALMVPGAVGAAAIGAAFGAIFTWYYHPLTAGGFVPRQNGSIFPVTGLAIAGWALLAYSVGILAGVLGRRVLPAVVVTLLVWTGLAFTASHLRQYDYQAPISTSRMQIATRDLQVENWWTFHGARISNARLDQVLQAAGAPSIDGGSVRVAPGQTATDPVSYLLQHGYTQWTSYQPDSRYWTFQGIEFGWLAVMSVLLLATATWLVRRRGG